MVKKLCLVFTGVLVLVAFIYGGTTGKLTGRIIDAETKEPLPGVNVIIEGTTLGASTDENGYYVILDVSPGSHSVVVSMIGFTTEKTKEVKVMVDLTTTINAELKATIIEGAEVVVVGKRPMIQKDITSSRTIIGAEELATMPVSSVNEALIQQTGISVDGLGYIHIRGGRDTEITYMLDGVKLVDPFSHMQDTRVPVDATQEASLFTGGFDAEYGEASSGVINIVTKEGGSRIEGGVKYLTNDFGPEKNRGDKNEHPQRLKRFDFNIGGPEPITSYLLKGLGLNVPGKGLKFFFAGEIYDNQSFIKFDDTQRQNFVGKLTYNVSSNLKVKVGGVVDNRDFHWAYGITSYDPTDNQRYSYLMWSDKDENGDPMFDRCPNYLRRVNTFYISMTHLVSPTTFYEIKLDRHSTRRHWNVDEDGMIQKESIWAPKPGGEDSVLIHLGRWEFQDDDSFFVSDGIDDFADTNNNSKLEINGIETDWFWNSDDLPYEFERRQNDDQFYISGYHRLTWQERNARTLTLKANLTSQMSRVHQVKTGFEYSHNTLFQYSADMASGGNIYMTTPYTAKPYSMAVFASDKMEFEGMIVNAGIRLDYFHSNWDSLPSDPYNPVPPEDLVYGGRIRDPTRTTSKWQISPRLGVSHPITENDVLHFTYGHYFQMPPMVFMYRNPWYDLSGAFPLIGNPELEAEKTISYEMGIEHAFTEEAMVDITAFYKDITHLLDTEQVYYTAANYYTRYQNADFGKVKGVEIALRKRPGGWLPYLSGALNYTISVATGKSSSERQNYDYTWSNWIIPAREHYLDWDERHQLSLNLALTVTKGNCLFNQRWLSDFGITTLTEYGSGRPWTPSSTTREQSINKARLPWRLTTSLGMYKNIRLQNFTMAFFVDIDNLFDRTDNIRVLTDPAWYEAKLAVEDRFGPGLTQEEINSGSGHRDKKAQAAKGMWDDPFALEPRRHIELGVEISF